MATKVTPVQQIKDMRDKLEKDIMALIAKFNKESGAVICRVEGIVSYDYGEVNDIDVDYQFPLEESDE